METSTLENQWGKIDLNSDHKSVRLTSECKPNLYIGFDEQNNRRLILSLLDAKLDINNDVREYIAIQYFDVSNHLIITLKEERFQEVFNAFILSVFSKIKHLDKANQAATQIVQLYYDWNELFTKQMLRTMPLSDVIGFYGELYVLHQKLDNAPSTAINENIKSWVGPYGRGHDFVSDNLDIEVKTIEYTKTDITISSEFQLESLEGKDLQLRVIKVEVNGQGGIPLSAIINNIRNLIISKLGDLGLFLHTLQQAGFPYSMIQEYDHYSFLVKEEMWFDCNLDNFPKLTASNVPGAVSGLKYKLKTNLLLDYLIEQKNY